MKERTILTWEEAKEFFKKELKDRYLPETWKEFCESYSIRQQTECFIDSESVIRPSDNGLERDSDLNRNLLPSNEAAVAHLALMQLHQLRDCYRQGWEPNWKDGESVKYAIIRREKLITVTSIWKSSSFLSFQRKEIAEQFLKNFKDLIEQAGDLI